MSKPVINFIARYFYAALSSVYLFTVGFLFVKNRLLIYKLSTHFGYPEVKIPVTPVSTLVPGDVAKDISIEVLAPVGVDGNVSPLELLLLSTFIKTRGCARIFEMGTFDGRTTLNMAANSAGNARLWTLDLPKKEIGNTPLPLAPLDKQFIDKDGSGARFTGKDEEKKITQLYGDTATFDFGKFNDSMDMVFVDASHSYEYLLNDSRAALRLLKGRKGIILWHDYRVWDGVTRALNELFLSDPDFKDLQHIEGTSLVCLIKN